MRVVTGRSRELTERVMELRDSKRLDWRAIGKMLGISHTAARLRYLRETRTDPRVDAANKAVENAMALAKDLEKLVDRQRAELDALRAELETERQRAEHAEQWEKKNSELIDALEEKIAHLREHIDAFVRSRAQVEATQ